MNAWFRWMLLGGLLLGLCGCDTPAPYNGPTQVKKMLVPAWWGAPVNGVRVGIVRLEQSQWKQDGHWYYGFSGVARVENLSSNDAEISGFCKEGIRVWLIDPVTGKRTGLMNGSEAVSWAAGGGKLLAGVKADSEFRGSGAPTGQYKIQLETLFGAKSAAIEVEVKSAVDEAE